MAGLAVALLGALAPGAVGATIDFPDFRSTKGLKLNGDAERQGKRLALTSATSQTGGVFTREQVVRPNRSFTTSFTLRQTELTFPPADGMAFVLQSAGPGTLGGGGFAQGYGEIDDSLAIEFDIFGNEELENDPFDNHVGVMRDGDASNHLELAFAPSTFWLTDREYRAWVRYSAENESLKIWLSRRKIRPGEPLIKMDLVLDEVLAGKAYAGFTAATGSLGSAQRVHEWHLKG